MYLGVGLTTGANIFVVGSLTLRTDDGREGLVCCDICREGGGWNTGDVRFTVMLVVVTVAIEAVSDPAMSSTVSVMDRVSKLSFMGLWIPAAAAAALNLSS
jgi:hypothetical protein